MGSRMGITEAGMRRLALLLVVLSMAASFFDFYTSLLVLSVAFVVYVSASSKGRESENTVVTTIEKGMTLRLERQLLYGFDVRPVFKPEQLKFMGSADVGDKREFTFECLGDGECAVRFEYMRAKTGPGEAQAMLKKFERTAVSLPGVVGVDIGVEGRSRVLVAKVDASYEPGTLPSTFLGVAVKVVEVGTNA